MTSFQAATQAMRRESLSGQQRLPWGPAPTLPQRAPTRSVAPTVPRSDAPVKD